MIFELTKCILDFEVSKLLDEKIKINVSISLREILLYDGVAFGIVKKNGEGNLNALLNKLIPALLKFKKKHRAESLRQVRQVVPTAKLSSEDTEKIIYSTNMVFQNTYFADENKEKISCVIWIRPSDKNMAVFDEIIESETEISGIETATYIRSLLNEYARFPLYKREQIVFAEECDKAMLARDSRRILRFRYEDEIHQTFVFACKYTYLMDQANYILCYDIGRNIICRYGINEIRALHLLEKKYKPTERIMDLCQKYYEDALWLEDGVFEIGGEV